MNIQVFESSQAVAHQLAKDIGYQLKKIIEQEGRAYLAVSGGKTPIALFEALSVQPLAWSKVLITLVDERWVDETHPASNAALVRRYLLQNEAETAYFLPLFNPSISPEEGYMQTENALQEQFPRCDIAIMGMGTDGHTASWFPHSAQLSACLDIDSVSRCCPIDTSSPDLPRITLTWSWLSDCRQLYLHTTGAEKATLLDHIIQRGSDCDFHTYPVARIIHQTTTPISVYRS